MGGRNTQLGQHNNSVVEDFVMNCRRATPYIVWPVALAQGCEHVVPVLRRA
jgi:hypothetical protein